MSLPKIKILLCNNAVLCQLTFASVQNVPICPIWSNIQEPKCDSEAFKYDTAALVYQERAGKHFIDPKWS